MESELNCPGCEKQYSESNPPRLLASCGHSFCENCLKGKVQEKDGKFVITCPQDNQQITLKENNVCNLPKNKALMKFIENKKANSSFKDPELQMSKIAKNEEAHNEDQQARQIVQAIALSNSVGQISQQKGSQEKQEQTKIQTQADNQVKQQPKQQQKQEKAIKKQQICQSHQKPLQVVCIIDMKRICVNCAIFGQHKGHEFKSLQEIENERAAYYSSILEIMQKKHTITDRISNQQTCSSIMDILGNKKLKIKNTISQTFKKLTQTIQSKQKQSLKNLDTLIQKTQTKLKNLMKIDNQIAQKYDNWEQKSFDQLKILQGDNFQAKLHLIFTDNGQETDVIEEGDQIINQMNKQQDSLFNEVETVMENIGVEFNLQIFNYIEGFIEIFDQTKKKKPKSRVSKHETQPNTFINPIPAPKNNFSAKKQQSLPQAKVQIQIEEKVRQSQLPKIQIISEKKSLRDHCHNQESLLQLQQQFFQKRPQFVKTEQIHIIPDPEIVVPSPARRDKNIVSPSSKLTIKNNSGVGISQPMSPKASKLSKKDDSFTQQKQQKADRPNKKKLAKLKLGQKYDKIVQSLVNDQTQIVDLTNAELGDATIILISQFLVGSKVKTVKYIRNKLSDDAVLKIMPYLRGVITLNLSQNNLTERVLDILIDNRGCLQSIKSVILSLNKIPQRKVKTKLDKLKSLDIIVSI